MRRSKIHRLLMIAGAAVLTAAMAAAQGAPAQGGEEGRHGWKGGDHEKAFSKLNLTDAQKEQLKTMHQSQRQEMEALRNDSSLTQEQRREKVQSLMKADHEKMLSILTPEQRQQVKDFRASRKGRGHRRGNGDGNTPPA